MRQVTIQTRGNPGTPKFVCFEDEEHTARCVAAIRKRRRREAEAQIVESKQ